MIKPFELKEKIFEKIYLKHLKSHQTHTNIPCSCCKSSNHQLKCKYKRNERVDHFDRNFLFFLINKQSNIQNFYFHSRNTIKESNIIFTLDFFASFAFA